MTEEQKLEEFQKCIHDPIHFIREYCYIPHQKYGEIKMGDFLYPKQEEFIRTMWTDRFVITNKTRQCLTKDNYVMTDRGYISIKDVKIGDKIETIIDGKSKFVNVLDSFHNGKKETYRILTNAGSEINCTADHKISTKRGWIETKDLTLDDEIVSKAHGFEKIRKIQNKKIKEDVYDITTESSDFLANGLLVHNCGFSTAIGCFALWFGLFNQNKHIVVVSINDSTSMEFLKQYVVYPYGRLPPWLKSEKLERTQSQNMHELGLYTGSVIRCASGKNAARGSANYMVIVDEVGFLEENTVKEIWSAVFPTIVTGVDGKVILNSTSSVAGTWYHEKFEAAKDRRSDFKPIEVDYWEVPHLNADPKYEENMRRELTPLSRFRREIMREFVVDEDPFIPMDFQDAMNEDPPIRSDFLRPEDYVEPEYMNPDEWKNIGDFDNEKNYMKHLWIWKDPEPRVSYCLSADVSEGDGDDNSTIEVFDLRNMEQVAEYSAKVDTFTFADIIMKVAMYYNAALVAPEANAQGNAVVSRIEKTFKYENLYYRPISHGLYAPGFKTTPGNRGDILTAYYKAIVQNKYVTHSSRLKRETRSLITKKGKTRAAQGTRDDLIMAYSIGAFLVQQNMIQQQFYNIDHDQPTYGQGHVTVTQTIADIKQYLEDTTEYKIDNSDYYRHRWMY